MAEPTIVPRAEHTISRSDVDPDALKVLYRLHEHHYIAYLVGGSVRDLLLNRRPKDFDIGTSAHPHRAKKLFRTCGIIGAPFGGRSRRPRKRRTSKSPRIQALSPVMPRANRRGAARTIISFTAITPTA